MKPYAQIAIFFALTQIVGIFAGIVLTDLASAYEEIRLLSVAPLPGPDDPLNAVFFTGYILVGAAAMVLAARFYKGMLLFRLLEAMVVSSASAIVFFALSLALLNLGFAGSLLLGMLAGLLLVAGKFLFAGAKNAAAIISSAGVGAIFGFSLGFLPAVLFVVLLSIYDYVAVFKTRHMIEMARELS